jgi:hypothetical protein
MSITPMTELNERMKSVEMPARVRKLPVSPAGYPTPWFVAWFDGVKPCESGRGTPDFRVIDSPKIKMAMNGKRCWICGEPLGVFLAFTIGPMCSINRVISEPPSHRECAVFSATACPFLSQPRMKRNASDLPVSGANQPAGIHIDRNPGVVCVWITKTYRPFNPMVGHPGVLFRIGDPVQTLWFAKGRQATRQEVVESIHSGLPSLMEIAKSEGADAVAHLNRQVVASLPLLPA